MVVSASDISFVLSGGASNIDPNKSIGGNPSAQPILGNTLFDNVSEDESDAGHVDHRCFYIFNDNLTETFFGTKIWIHSEVANGATVEIGFNIQDDLQTITIVGPLTGGTSTFTFDSNNFNVAFNSDLATFGSNFATALNALSDLSEVQVSASIFNTGLSSETRIFEILFQGNDGKRNQPQIALSSNGYTGAISVTIAKLVEGGPINSIAPEIDVETTAPSGITFTYPTEIAPQLIGDLKALEGFPVWVKRTTDEETEALESDGFTVRFQGSPIGD